MPPAPTPAPPSFEPRVDGHLDLAHNAVAIERDLDLELDVLRSREGRPSQTGMITWPELRRAHIDLVVATLFAHPAERAPMQALGTRAAPPYPEPPAYHDAQGAFEQADTQLRYYERLEHAGTIRIVRDRSDLQSLRKRGHDEPIGVVVLMEGADPIRTPDETGWWFERGVRLIGPAWQRTRYAGGTRAPGPLTELGRSLLDEMASVGMALDVSHLSDESLHEALERFGGPVVASHSNARALTPTDRHLSDEALRALAERDAVVGIVLGNSFLDASAAAEGRQVTLATVRAQVQHVASILGPERVGIGSDLDGGFGAEESPVELTRGSDFGRLAEAAADGHGADLLGLAWWRWLERSLPSGDPGDGSARSETIAEGGVG
ncbi:membrane dipeptidase [soil metagenome]